MFTIRHVVEQREGFGPFRYEILQEGRVVAHYWHDFRGDDHGIEFLDGTRDNSPVGSMTAFLSGGGPSPLVLSKAAIAYLNVRLKEL